MPRLDPKVTVYRFSIRKGPSPKKQLQESFWPKLVPKIKKRSTNL